MVRLVFRVRLSATRHTTSSPRFTVLEDEGPGWGWVLDERQENSESREFEGEFKEIIKVEKNGIHIRPLGYGIR